MQKPNVNSLPTIIYSGKRRNMGSSDNATQRAADLSQNVSRWARSRTEVKGVAGYEEQSLFSVAGCWRSRARRNKSRRRRGTAELSFIQHQSSLLWRSRKSVNIADRA